MWVGVIHPPRVDRHKATYVMIGAHYDHLGHGEVGGFDLEGEKHQIHNGADDNASGVALVLEVTAAFRKRVEQAPEDVSGADSRLVVRRRVGAHWIKLFRG